jgi:hypothetical protein
MFGGKCAYCGCELGEKWHADHVQPVYREYWKKNGGMIAPENDCLSNIFPSCPPCNIDKHASSLEDWRRRLQRLCTMLDEYAPNYRHAKRFGLVQETGRVVVFYFETLKAGAK